MEERTHQSQQGRRPRTPDEAYQELRDGNRRFVEGQVRRPRVDVSTVAETARHGQKPFAVILACSDSRVPVEIVLDQGIGDLLVVRTAGNVCNVDQTGTIEFGLMALDTPLIVIMGHTGCAAVGAAAAGTNLGGMIPVMIDAIAPAVMEARSLNPGASPTELADLAAERNAWWGLARLLRQSPMVRDSVGRGRCRAVAALYEIETGRVRWLGDHPEQDALLGDSPDR
ncbi:MAG: carbonic anhydrase, partial [Phycisphaerae bacterium]|nr:carbonic anhydrase [Phycisphaerae bacterium]